MNINNYKCISCLHEPKFRDFLIRSAYIDAQIYIGYFDYLGVIYNMIPLLPNWRICVPCGIKVCCKL